MREREGATARHDWDWWYSSGDQTAWKSETAWKRERSGSAAYMHRAERARENEVSGKRWGHRHLKDSYVGVMVNLIWEVESLPTETIMPGPPSFLATTPPITAWQTFAARTSLSQMSALTSPAAVFARSLL